MDRAIEAKLHECDPLRPPYAARHKDLLQTAKVVKPSTREWFSTAKNHAMYANQGGIYDDILTYLKIK